MQDTGDLDCTGGWLYTLISLCQRFQGLHLQVTGGNLFQRAFTSAGSCRTTGISFIGLVISDLCTTLPLP